MHVQSNTRLLSDLFQKFRNMCLQIYELNPTRFITALELARQAALKKTKVKLDLLSHIDKLLMLEKGIIRGGIITNTRKIMIKIKNRHIFNIGM